MIKIFKLVLLMLFLQIIFVYNSFAEIVPFGRSNYGSSYRYFENHDYNKLSDIYQEYTGPTPDIISDPFEPVNRIFFDFNSSIDLVIGSPLVNYYRNIVPTSARKHITYFFKNTKMPITFINNLLQGDFQGANYTFWRFFINIFWGFGGIADFATDIGINNRTKDLDQTCAKWNIPSGPYLVLPLFGPTTLRGAVSKVADFLIDPTELEFARKWRKDSAYLRTLNFKSENNDLLNAINKSLDPYTTMKSLYIQNKINQLAK